MYLWSLRKGGKVNRSKSNRLRAKQKAKNRRRVNRMHGRKLNKRLARVGKRR